MNVDANIPYGCLCTHPLHIWILKQLCPDLHNKKTKDSIQRVCSCGKIQFWIVECKREVKHAQFFGKIKKKGLYSHYSDSSDQVDHI